MVEQAALLESSIKGKCMNGPISRQNCFAFLVGNSCLLWYGFTLLCDWLQKLAPLFQPISSKIKTNSDLFASVFLRLTSVSCICFQL